MEENRKKQPKMSQSCAKVALRGKNCIENRNFLGGLIRLRSVIHIDTVTRLS